MDPKENKINLNLLNQGMHAKWNFSKQHILIPLRVLDILGIFSLFTTLFSTDRFFTSLKIMLNCNISSMLVHMKVMSLNCGILKRNVCDPRIFFFRFCLCVCVCVCAFQPVIPPDKLFTYKHMEFPLFS